MMRSLTLLLVVLLAACGQPDGAQPEREVARDDPAAPASAAPLPAGGNGEPAEPGLAAADNPGGGAITEPQPGSPGSSGGAEVPAATANAPADPSASAILRRAERTYAGVRSMQADFVQRVTVPLLDQTQRSRGTIFHRRPDRFLMRFSDPQGDVIVADGRHLWMYYPSADAKQVLRTTLAEAGSTVDLQQEFLSDTDRRFSVTHEGVENVAGRSADRLRLIPREPSQYLRVTIWVDRQDSMVRRFEMVEQNESVRMLELSNLRPNVSLPDDLFRFTPPAGAEVFDS